MGTPMVRNLLAAGYPVTVYARRPSAAEPLTSAGATTAASPAALAAAALYSFRLRRLEITDQFAVLRPPDRRAEQQQP